MKFVDRSVVRGAQDQRGGPRSASPELNRVERVLRLRGSWEDAAAQIEHHDAIRYLAQHDGVTVADAVLQQAVDALRAYLGLTDVRDTLTWLAEAGLSLEDVETELEAQILEDVLCGRLSSREIEDGFQKVRIRFDLVLLRVFVVDDPESGRALATRLRDAQDSRRGHELLERCVGQRMEWGWYFREELPERAATQIFKARPGAVVGPIEIGECRHALYGIEAFRPATLDAEIEGRLRKEMVAESAREIMNPDDPGRYVLK
ncbi:MAG: hypothetical protein ABI607_14480 [Betaproteobacteria bacterium]